MDNLVLYNGGYRILNGYIPFNDYWLVTGPLMDYLNGLFFYFLGVNWTSFLIHSSIFNVLITISTFFLFLKIGLNKNLSFFYSILFSILMYPSVGTPFVDHHSTIFIMLAFYCFIIGVIQKKYFLFTLIPLLSTFSFFSKQTPATYGIISLFFLIVFFIIYKKDFSKKIFFIILNGSVFSLILILFFFLITKININNFFEQYILYAKTIGSNRVDITGFNFLNLLIEFKFIFALLIPLFFLIPFLIKRKIDTDHYFVIASITTFSIMMVFHQKLTFNQNYIFFLIPLLAGFLHFYLKLLYSKKNIIFIFIIFLCSLSVLKYHLRFNEHRKFNELEKVNIKKAIDAKEIHKSLKGLKWITANYPNNPQNEINDLTEAMNIIKLDGQKKSILTNYQFIAPALLIYDFSPNQWHHPTVSFPIEGQKYFEKYKNFFINNIIKNEIQIIYTVGIGEKNLVELILDNTCFQKKKKGNIIFAHKLIKNCKDFK
tara:strand:+ start:3600 stop:5057 length:1458 start_codon:yes stop_codon:yes gene_type:complete